MFNADKETLKSFFANNHQYIVPFFQRSYVWKEENWSILWEHINDLVNGSNNEHFIGTIIANRLEDKKVDRTQRSIIDGQQRLTTIAILLKAISNRATNKKPFVKLQERINELLISEDTRGQKYLRLELSRNDKDYFEAIMYEKVLKEGRLKDHKLLECYKYFYSLLESLNDSELDSLKDIVLNKISVISMLLTESDDAQQIFDTINSLGSRLKTGELLKNYIFSDKVMKEHFDNLWEKTFEEDENQYNFWNSPKTSGRSIRTNIEVLLYCFLIIKTKRNVELDKLFNEYKNYLRNMRVDEKVAFLKELNEYAKIYIKFPSGIELNEISYSESDKRFFHIIENLEITTVYPLILFIYKQVADENEIMNILKLLESYIVRRAICRLTSKNYNNLFIQLYDQLRKTKKVTRDKLSIILKNFKEDSNRFPTDEEFQDAFFAKNINMVSSKEILYCISLSYLGSKNDRGKLSSSSFSIEHIMPRKWEKFWGKKGMSEIEKSERESKIRSIGNLTLITKPLNSSMRNAAWKKKRVELKKYSTLKITTDYLNIKQWDETQINKRAKKLSEKALKIWE